MEPTGIVRPSWFLPVVLEDDATTRVLYLVWITSAMGGSKLWMGAPTSPLTFENGGRWKN